MGCEICKHVEAEQYMEADESVLKEPKEKIVQMTIPESDNIATMITEEQVLPSKAHLVIDSEIKMPHSGVDENHTEVTVNSEESKISLPKQEYDYDEHSRKIFETINKLRADPPKYIKKIDHLIKHIDMETNSIEIKSESVKILLPENMQAMDSVAFLQCSQPQGPLLWSSMLYCQAYEDLNTMIQSGSTTLVEGNRNLIHGQNFEIIKVMANFIVDPKISTLLIFLISDENRKIIFSEDIYEAAVVTLPKNIDKNNFSSQLAYTNEGFTLIYFARPL